jgi:mannose-6-phosphate isomerase-like protein (cupin superfamily)
MIANDVLKIGLVEALGALSHHFEPFVTVFERRDLSVELFVPIGADTQQPHGRDEIYVIVLGEAVFVRDGQRAHVSGGDILYVPARAPHRFEEFSDDFQTWAIFFGPEQPAQARAGEVTGTDEPA